jgi:hypothetical protein
MKSQAWKIAGMVIALGGSVAMAQDGGKTNAPPKMKGQKPNPEKMLKRFDTDDDGKLNEAERQAMHEAMPKRGGGPGGPQHQRPGRGEAMKRFDTDGDGVLSEAEREAMRTERKRFQEENMKRFDADGDGRLSEEERKIMWETLRDERPAPPPEESGAE